MGNEYIKNKKQSWVPMSYPTPDLGPLISGNKSKVQKDQKDVGESEELKQANDDYTDKAGTGHANKAKKLIGYPKAKRAEPSEVMRHLENGTLPRDEAEEEIDHQLGRKLDRLGGKKKRRASADKQPGLLDILKGNIAPKTEDDLDGLPIRRDPKIKFRG